MPSVQQNGALRSAFQMARDVGALEHERTARKPHAPLACLNGKRAKHEPRSSLALARRDVLVDARFHLGIERLPRVAQIAQRFCPINPVVRQFAAKHYAIAPASRSA